MVIIRGRLGRSTASKDRSQRARLHGRAPGTETDSHGGVLGMIPLCWGGCRVSYRYPLCRAARWVIKSRPREDGSSWRQKASRPMLLWSCRSLERRSSACKNSFNRYSLRRGAIDIIDFKRELGGGVQFPRTGGSYRGGSNGWSLNTCPRKIRMRYRRNWCPGRCRWRVFNADGFRG